MRLRTSLSCAAAVVAAAVSAGPASAALVGISGLTLSNGDPAQVTAEPTLVQSFTVASGTVSSLGAPASATGVNGTVLRPVGGADTPNGAIVAADLDVSRGLANVNGGTTNVFDVQFGQTLTGAAGAGNDIFLIDFGQGPNSPAGDDSLTIFALDSSGTVVGTPLAVLLTDFGATGKTGIFSTTGANSLTRQLAGIAFDVEDFGVVAGGISGIRLGSTTNASGLDPLAIGFNTAAVGAPPVVPEPSAGLLSLGGLALLAAKRRRRA